jgi:hypothetical protein
VITPDQLERAQDGKAESFFYTYTAKGSALAVGLQAALEESLSKLPIPKVMSYQRQFGGPARRALRAPGARLVALHGQRRGADHHAGPDRPHHAGPPLPVLRCAADRAPTPTPKPWLRKARSSPASPSAAKRSAPRCWPRPVPTRC